MIQSVGWKVCDFFAGLKGVDERKRYKAMLLANIRAALDALHENGFAHCDLHIENVFFMTRTVVFSLTILNI